MDARLTDEQRRIRETAREFVEDNGGIEFARRAMEGEDVVGEVWSHLDDLDYTALTIPLEHGGFGEGMVYLSALLEELGRYALPGPYPETAAFCVPLIDELGGDEQKETYFEAIDGGGRTMSFALHDDRNEEVPRAITMAVESDDGGYRLSGTKTLVPYGGEVDRVVVAARDGDAADVEGFDGVSLFLVDPAEDGVAATRLRSLDRTRPMYDLEFDDVVVGEGGLLGPRGGGGEALSRAIDRFNVAACSMLVGAADRAVDLSVEHGNERTQYGQPVGRFQAVKHRIAEMAVDVEQVRSLTYRAAWAIDEGRPEAARAASAAKAYAAEHLPRVFRDDIWNHGGMGFTWDHDAHVYLKGATAWANFLGSAGYHLDRVADLRDYSGSTLPDYPDLEVGPYR